VEEKRKILKQMKMGTTEFLVLIVLNEKDRYGYEIAREVHERSGGFFEFKQGFLYPALQRMERADFLDAYWRRSNTGGPNRKYYRLTKKGSARLAAFVEAWAEFGAHLEHWLTAARAGDPLRETVETASRAEAR